MISLYSGTPGSGKSLHLAEYLYYRIKNVRAITIGNFALNKDNIRGRKKGTYLYVNNSRLTPQRLIHFTKRYAKRYKGKIKEGQFLLVIDEAQMLFNSRDWNAPNRKQWLEFFTIHRHCGFDIVLIAQYDRMLDRQVRSLFEYESIHRKVTNFGWKGKLLFVLNGFKPLFVSVKMWYPMKTRVSSHFFRLNKRYMSIYDTFATFASGES